MGARGTPKNGLKMGVTGVGDVGVVVLEFVGCFDWQGGVVGVDCVVGGVGGLRDWHVLPLPASWLWTSNVLSSDPQPVGLAGRWAGVCGPGCWQGGGEFRDRFRGEGRRWGGWTCRLGH
jgi:hypothetical protein